MDPRFSEEVWSRARQTCEYCRIQQNFILLPFQIDHIIAKKHGGQTTLENLALACFACNAYKGPNIAGLDPVTGEVVRPFHPRRDVWREHFTWNGAYLVGRTPIGRATVEVLLINHDDHVCVREESTSTVVF